MLKDAVSTLLQTIDHIVTATSAIKNVSRYEKTTSLVDVTKLARVEPLTVVSRDCITIEYLPDVLQTLLSVFSGYYLQAVAIAAQVYSVRVIKTLDKLNPDRSPNNWTDDNDKLWDFGANVRDSLKKTVGMLSVDTENVTLSLESYEYKLPIISQEAIRLNRVMNRSAVSANTSQTASTSNNNDTPSVGYSVKDDIGAVIVDMSNQAVGKMLLIDIKTDTSKDSSTVRVPVTVRLSPVTMTNSGIVHILALKSEDTGLVERYHAWRSGRISFIKDLIFCQDMINEHKKALLNDEEGVYSEILRRVVNAKKYGVITKNPSLISASNLFVISESIARDLENRLGGKLSNARIRQRAFDNTYAMIICVIDREYDRVTFYHRGIDAYTEVSIRDIKSSNKSKGPDIMDILKAYQLGQSPVF